MNPRLIEKQTMFTVMTPKPIPAVIAESFKWPTKIRLIAFREVSHARPMIDGRDSLKMSHHAFE